MYSTAKTGFWHDFHIFNLPSIHVERNCGLAMQLLRVFAIRRGLAFSGQSEYGILTIMRSDTETIKASFSLGGRRYLASALKASRASGFFEAAERNPRDSFLRGIHELSAEDEDMPLPDDQSPIVFKDGIFQIDVSNAGVPPSIDTALKGLIDSILGT
ncbi:MAG: hypothetical protein CVV53_02955 [Spirochaetae bacterium HGW-Spirochaetae-9]|nr:MAG: hypothetical protein CVV53_02955 [Spirochaetae bacterium HGW-Spirochaetae-9]